MLGLRSMLYNILVGRKTTENAGSEKTMTTTSNLLQTIDSFVPPAPQRVLIQRCIEHNSIEPKWVDWKLVDDDTTQINYALREFKQTFDPFRRKSKHLKTFRLKYVDWNYKVSEPRKFFGFKKQRTGEEILHGIMNSLPDRTPQKHVASLSGGVEFHWD